MSQYVQRYVEALDGWFEFDRTSGQFTDPDIHVAVARTRAERGPMVIRDLEPYKTVVADVATGKPVTIGGRRQHREFLKRNGYAEVGNEFSKPRREELGRSERISDIRRAMNDH